MAEVIDFLQRSKQIKQSYIDEDIDIEDAKVISKDIFYETLMTLEELGYSPHQNSQLLKDLEALCFISCAMIFRAHNNKHPANRLLDEAFKDLQNTIEVVGESLHAENDNKIQ
jgi:hypothetical protein